MGSPISPGEAIAIVKKSYELYKKIQNCPEEMEEVGKRMCTLQGYLQGVQDLLNSRGGLNALRPEQNKQLKSILLDVKADAGKVYVILKEWKEVQIQTGVTKWAKQTWFAVVKDSPAQLETLGDKLDDHIRDIAVQINLLNTFGIQQLMQTQLPSRQSRSRGPLGTDYKVIFIDNTNVGRSCVAEAYARLVQAWTLQSQGTWRIRTVHSAGWKIKHESDIWRMQVEKLRMEMLEGTRPPDPTALDALFDNKLFKYPFKAQIAKQARENSSRGLTQRLFTDYDFIILFTRLDIANLMRIRDALKSANGPSAAPRGKGKVVLLGEYGGLKEVEIFNPSGKKMKQESRAEWNGVVSNIKVAFKGFLKKELDWKKPGR